MRKKPVYHLHNTKELAAPAAVVVGTSHHQSMLSKAGFFIRISELLKYGSDYVIVSLSFLCFGANKRDRAAKRVSSVYII